MPESIPGALPQLVPSQATVEAVARKLYEMLPAAPPYDALEPFTKWQISQQALELVLAAAPLLIADAVSLVAEHPAAFGLDDLDRMFDWSGFASNVSFAANTAVPATA